MQVTTVQLDQDTPLTVVIFSDADLVEPEPTQKDEVVSVN